MAKILEGKVFNLGENIPDDVLLEIIKKINFLRFNLPESQDEFETESYEALAQELEFHIHGAESYFKNGFKRQENKRSIIRQINTGTRQLIMRNPYIGLGQAEKLIGVMELRIEKLSEPYMN